MPSTDVLIGQTVYLVMFAGIFRAICSSEDKAKELVDIYAKKYELVKDTLELNEKDKPFYYVEKIV